MLQIVHTVRPAVLYPQASRSLCTQWLRLYPTMQTAMHLQCRVQLLAKSQHPIATLNSDSARSQSVGGTSVAAFAASRDALIMLRVSFSAVSTQRRPRRVFITCQLESFQRTPQAPDMPVTLQVFPLAALTGSRNNPPLRALRGPAAATRYQYRPQ